MDTSKRYSIFDRNIISDVFGAEVVLVNLVTGVYYSLQGTATPIWLRVLNHYSIDESIAELCQLHEGDPSAIQTEVLAFYQQLLENQLIRVSEEQEKKPLAMSQEAAKTPFTTPVMNKYSDMQEILLLDPVHDVDKEGWPVMKDNPPSA